ncbi:hypothetical protein C7B62_13445 [Pleurocapsa sp. CCALA 161]|uniref:hypothetical protein n=1 Tax=Pleurocapsa sp. CCALA 161 TaxID=2107688 RepID=UPI000D07DB71|nr:hypothetical protein [Pleurocapsa sp. CCALA 161]PSB09376.1 hypothetical protein C7B62_13445 [Pleurocapsa sp. CCALA 161]
MINWCKQNTLLLLITSSFWSGQSSDVADSIVTRAECRNLNTTYQNVYSFETENHHINICQVGKKFYYYRQSKLDANDNLLVPAEALVRGNIFLAKAGKMTYFVGMDSDRYYSSVMSNNNEIVFEPQISASSACTQDSAQANNRSNLPTDLPINYSLERVNNNSLNSASFDLNYADFEQITICNPAKSLMPPFVMLELK